MKIWNIWLVSVAAVLAFMIPVAFGESVVIYSSVDRDLVKPLIQDFKAAHPRIEVDYRDLQSFEIYSRVIKEASAGAQADIVWSSAIDLQIKLVNDGYAMPHRSAETEALPSWAHWRNEAFGTTFEPIGFAYNRNLLDSSMVPQTRAELIRLIEAHPQQMRNRIATYSPHLSGLGYLLHSQDLEANPVVFWNLLKIASRAGLRVENTTREMIDSIAEGKAVLAYNVLLPYAMSRASTDRRIGVVFPKDYTLVMSRVIFLNRSAPHPEAGKIWLDYVLSKRGQRILNQIGLYSVRPDVGGSNLGIRPGQKLDQVFRPIVLNTGLLTYLDQMKQALFFARWNAALEAQSGRY